MAPIRSRETKNNSASAVRAEAALQSLDQATGDYGAVRKYYAAQEFNEDERSLQVVLSARWRAVVANRMTGFGGLKKRAQTAPSPLRKDPVG